MAKGKKARGGHHLYGDGFHQWYTDICIKAELIDYTSTKGMFILRPYGYAIWRTSSTIWTGSSSAPAMRTWPCRR